MTHEETFDLQLAKECARSFAGACGVGCTVSDASGRCLFETGYGCASCRICHIAGREEADCIRTHLYGMTEAVRFGGKYIYTGPMGLTCFVSPILGDEGVAAKLTVGPFLMVEQRDYIAYDLEECGKLHGEPLQRVIQELDNIPYFPPERITEMSNLLFMAVGFMNNVADAERMRSIQGSGAIQGQITAYIQEIKHTREQPPYPFEQEQKLLRAVRQMNKPEANRLLNELLGHILFSSGGNMEQIKPRLYELLVMIGRTAIEAGADPDKTLQTNHHYLVQMERSRDFDALCGWLAQECNTLMDSIFDFTGVRHTNVIHRTIQYLNTHYQEKITLEEVAQRVFLSPAYFSRVFKAEMGESFTAYLNRIRIERSKELLRHKNIRLTDIAQLVGFEDQSYFTKVFKKLVGVPPLQYRNSKDWGTAD